jgi:antitoxin YefM
MGVPPCREGGDQRSHAPSASTNRVGLNIGLDHTCIWIYDVVMQTLSISAAKAKLSELVDTAENTREEYAITVNGAPVAMLIGVSEWESLQETLFWLSQPNILDDVTQAQEDLAGGKGVSEDEVRARFVVPRRPAR